MDNCYSDNIELQDNDVEIHECPGMATDGENKNPNWPNIEIRVTFLSGRRATSLVLQKTISYNFSMVP